MAGPESPDRQDDLLQPFQIENHAARGRLVRMGQVVDDALAGHDYPEAVANLLGETMALTALVSGALKFDGVFTIQAKGNGAVRMLVADITTDGAMRGYAQYDEEAVAELIAGAEPEDVAQKPIQRLLGTGYLAFTVDQGPDTERYQGIVELTGATVAECAHNYFRQSDQLEAVVKLAAGPIGSNGGGHWRAAGLMIQRLPEAQGPALYESEDRSERAEEDWRRAVMLMGSCTTGELLDDALHPHDLLYRLFHEDGVRVFDPQALQLKCRCSEPKVRTMLRSFPRSEIEDMKVGDLVVVTCEFCGTKYAFDDDALDEVYEDEGAIS